MCTDTLSLILPSVTLEGQRHARFFWREDVKTYTSRLVTIQTSGEPDAGDQITKLHDTMISEVNAIREVSAPLVSRKATHANSPPKHNGLCRRFLSVQACERAQEADTRRQIRFQESVAPVREKNDSHVRAESRAGCSP